GFDVFQELVAEQDDPLVAEAGGFIAPIGNDSFPHPGDEILIHDVAGDEAAGFGVEHWAAPCGDLVLHERLAIFRHAAEAPGDAESVFVVDRNAPLEMIAGEKSVGPKTDADHL